MEKRPLSLMEYNRIYQTICGVLKGITAPEKSCVFFASVGSYLLNKHFQIPARPVAGGFALCVNEEPKVGFFGKVNEKTITSANDGFHMWIQTKTHLIDFMAPLFSEAFAEKMPGIQIPRKMFQRAITTESTNLDSFKGTGDFYTLPNPDLTEQLSDNFLARRLNTDLLYVVENWFGSPGGKQQPTFTMRNEVGEVEHLTLPTSVAIGSW